MRQLILLSLLCSSLSVWAAEKTNDKSEFNRLFEDFQKQKIALLKADLSKKNAKEQVNEAFQKMDTALEAIVALEAKNKDTLLTSEGNEMAYDLETIRPLKDLASSLMNAEACTQAREEHDLNYPVVKDEQAETITKLIDKICK